MYSAARLRCSVSDLQAEDIIQLVVSSSAVCLFVLLFFFCSGRSYGSILDLYIKKSCTYVHNISLQYSDSPARLSAREVTPVSSVVTRPCVWSRRCWVRTPRRATIDLFITSGEQLQSLAGFTHKICVWVRAPVATKNYKPNTFCCNFLHFLFIYRYIDFFFLPHSFFAPTPMQEEA